MAILSYVLSVLGLISMLIPSFIKGKRMRAILFFVFLGNVLIATSYLAGGTGINGAAAGYLGSLQAIINFLFLSKDKPIPKWLIALHILSGATLNIWVAKGFDLMVAIVLLCGLAFVMGIVSKSGAKHRFWAIVNIALWCIYDLISGSWSVLITHGFQLVVTVVGAIIHDRKKAEKSV